eukprot:5578211-Pleurochrysis_carterae.AAC.1
MGTSASEVHRGEGANGRRVSRRHRVARKTFLARSGGGCGGRLFGISLEARTVSKAANDGS